MLSLTSIGIRLGWAPVIASQQGRDYVKCQQCSFLLRLFYCVSSSRKHLAASSSSESFFDLGELTFTPLVGFTGLGLARINHKMSIISLLYARSAQMQKERGETGALSYLSFDQTWEPQN